MVSVFIRERRYDAAADPWSGHRIWAVLGIPRPPGVRLLPSFWFPGIEPPMQRLPHHPVSLILQYERPAYLRGASAKQWHRWKRPYYRFERTSEQQRVLRRFERAIDSRVVVRYASPAFWQRCELERNQYMRTVLQSSGFVSPSVLGNHQAWTYERPGTVGYPNPAGRGRVFETIDEILAWQATRTQEQELVPTNGFDDHLDDLASLALHQEPALARSLISWHDALQAAPLGLSNAVIQRLTSYAPVQSILTRIGASWYIREEPSPEP